VADATTATGDRPVLRVQHRFDDVAHERLDHEKERRGPQQHRPAGIHRGRERQREHG
jgi:hypothetical protein